MTYLRNQRKLSKFFYYFTVKHSTAELRNYCDQYYINNLIVYRIHDRKYDRFDLEDSVEDWKLYKIQNVWGNVLTDASRNLKCTRSHAKLGPRPSLWTRSSAHAQIGHAARNGYRFYWNQRKIRMRSFLPFFLFKYRIKCDINICFQQILLLNSDLNR